MIEKEMDVAASLRELAANSDEITGKILKKSQEAAKKGASYIEFRISEEDFHWLRARKNGVPREDKPPYIEKLESLGFKLDFTEKETGWSKFKNALEYCDRSYNYYIIVRW